MPAKKSKPKKTSTKRKKSSKDSKSIRRSIRSSRNVKGFKGAVLKLGDIFSFSTKAPAKQNFSSSFEYENFMIDLKGNQKNGKASLNFKIEGKDFSSNGVITISERTFNNLRIVFDHLFSSISPR